MESHSSPLAEGEIPSIQKETQKDMQNRREFLGNAARLLGAAVIGKPACVLGAEMAEGPIRRNAAKRGATANTQDEIPSFVMEQAAETFQRLEEWRGDEETLLFPILTDVHTQDKETWRHIGWMVETDKIFHYDFMANLGDIGLNLGSPHSNANYSDQILKLTQEQMMRYKGPFIYAAGNHDWDGGEGRHLTSQNLHDTFQRYWTGKYKKYYHIVDGKVYGYYDIPKKNVRVIILNSQGTETIGEYYTYGNEQLEWLIGLLKETKPGTHLVLLSHYMPHWIGRWTSVENVVRPTCEILLHILQDFAERKRGAEQGIEWDFTEAQGILAGLFCGDSHANLQVRDHGVNYYITQGLGPVSPSSLLYGQKHADFDYQTTLCCDVIAIKPASRQVKSFRIGAGGKRMDMEFSYAEQEARPQADLLDITFAKSGAATDISPMVNRISKTGFPAAVFDNELGQYVYDGTRSEWGTAPDRYHYFDMQDKIWNQITDGFSLECYVRPSWSGEERPSSWCSILGYQQNGGFGMVVGSDGKWLFQPHIGGRYVNLKSDAQTVKDRWTHLVATWNRESGKASLYVDGMLAAQTDCPGELKAPDSSFRRCFLGCDLRGADGAAEAAFRGQIATLRLYRDAFTPNEVAKLFETATGLPVVQVPRERQSVHEGTYNLLGQNVQSYQHGVYIHNGKKILVK